jgi:hypothetical protein
MAGGPVGAGGTGRRSESGFGLARSPWALLDQDPRQAVPLPAPVCLLDCPHLRVLYCCCVLAHSAAPVCGWALLLCAPSLFRERLGQQARTRACCCTHPPRRAAPMLSSHHARHAAPRPCSPPTTYILRTQYCFCHVGAGRSPPGGRWRPRTPKKARHDTSPGCIPSLPLTLTANLPTPNAECLSGLDQEGTTSISCRGRALARLHHPASPPDCCTCIC